MLVDYSHRIKKTEWRLARTVSILTVVDFHLAAYHTDEFTLVMLSDSGI